MHIMGIFLKVEIGMDSAKKCVNGENDSKVSPETRLPTFLV
jgi:hypothetical protein